MSNKEFWRYLGVLENKVRIEVIQILLDFELLSLSEIRRKLQNKIGRRISLSGLLKHMDELEIAGIVRRESGLYLEEPDPRKKVYLIQGKERVTGIMQVWSELGLKLAASIEFNKLARVARDVFAGGTVPQEKELKNLECYILRCEEEWIFSNLTEHEEKKLKFWKLWMSSTKKYYEDRY